MANRGPEMLQDSFAVFPAPDAYQWEYRSYQGTRFYAQGQFQGEDRPYGALLTYWVRPGGPADTTTIDPDSIDVSRLTKFSMIAPEIKEDIPARETGSAEQAYANQDDEIETIAPPQGKGQVPDHRRAERRHHPHLHRKAAVGHEPHQLEHARRRHGNAQPPRARGGCRYPQRDARRTRHLPHRHDLRQTTPTPPS